MTRKWSIDEVPDGQEHIRGFPEWRLSGPNSLGEQKSIILSSERAGWFMDKSNEMMTAGMTRQAFLDREVADEAMRLLDLVEDHKSRVWGRSVWSSRKVRDFADEMSEWWDARPRMR